MNGFNGFNPAQPPYRPDGTTGVHIDEEDDPDLGSPSHTFYTRTDGQ